MITISFLLVFLGCLVSSEQTTCPGVSFYAKETSDQMRLTMLQDGNYTIQALLTLSQSDKCQKISRTGLIQMYAMKYAIEQFNNNYTYSKYATIGLQLDDVCGKLPVTMARGIEVVSFHRPDSVCRADFLKCDKNSPTLKNVTVKEASAIIGTGMSFTTIPLASLMSLYDIPQVSPSASSRLLSKKNLYRSFFRTIPSDTNQISVMLDIFKQFSWNYIFAIGSDDDYGKLGISELKQEATSRGICIFKDEYIPYRSVKTKSKIEDVVKKIKDGDKAQVVVLFTYVGSIGEEILAEAQRQGIQRIWLTSEAWNPSAVNEFVKPKHNWLRNQTHGILTVSLKRYKLQYLIDYMEKEIKTNYMCNTWLQEYLKNTFNCTIDTFDNATNQFSCNPSSDVLPISTILADIGNLPGTVDNLIDAVTSLGYAMHSALKDECKDTTPCYKKKLDTSKITNEMSKVNFTNRQGEQVSYKNGDPEIAFYTIENLVWKGNNLEYVSVGNWTKNNLELDADRIKWPSWFNLSQKESSHPESRCSKKCQPGERVAGMTGCCWVCHKCTDNNYTSEVMQNECKECGQYKHTIDNIHCVDTPIKWLEINDPAGMSIVIVSIIGFIGIFIASIFMFKYRTLVTIHDKSPHMLTFVCVLLFLTFIYGPLHITKPTDLLCQVRNSYFFILLMMYCAFVLVKTQAMTGYLRGHAEKSFGGNLLMTQLLVLFMFFMLEVVSVVAWLYVDGLQVKEFRDIEKYSILKQCKVEFTAARLVSTFIPCIILIIATFCAFRERNADHSFYEPKFLSFSCIALCIIIVAFLPTFKYVVGIYKAIVLAFTMNVFGYTFMACLILPKVYVGVMRKRRGINQYPVKPGATKRKKKKEGKKKKTDEFAESSVIESLKTKSTINEPSELGDSVDVTDANVEEKPMDSEIKFNGINNTYDNQANNGIHTEKYIPDVNYSNGETPESSKV